MKIIQVNNTYKRGSTGKIVYDMHSFFKKEKQESIVCYGRLDDYIEPKVYKICGEVEAGMHRLQARISGIKFGGCILSTRRLIRIIKKEQPDIVHLQCINGYFLNVYNILRYLKKNKINTVLTLHAEFMYTANCGHALDCEKWRTGCGKCPRLKEDMKSFFIDNTALSWNKMKKAFDNFNTLRVVSVSTWLQERAEASPILENKKHLTILNGIDTEVFNLKNSDKSRMTRNLVGKKIILHVTSNFSLQEAHIKGGYYVIEMARKFLKYDPKVIFFIVGKHDNNLRLPENVILVDDVTDQEHLAEYYSMADVTLLTSKKETFSMVTAESLCCGTPVVGFLAGAPELITIDQFSSFVEHGNQDLLFESLKNFIYEKKFDKEQISIVSKNKFSKEVMCGQYLNLYKEILAENK